MTSLSNRIRLLFLLIFLLVFSACTPFIEQKNSDYKVSWHSGYRSFNLSAEPFKKPMNIEGKDDLNRLLKTEWYDPYDVMEQNSGQHFTLNNCEQYIEKATARLFTVVPYENDSFTVKAMMCRATVLLINANPAEKSYIPEKFLNTNLPSQWPRELALVLSLSRLESIKSDPKIRYWQDVDTNLQYRFVDDENVEFTGEGSIQRIALVGRGDFNHDGVEDVLITSSDSVIGGSFFNERLFALTVNVKGEWLLLKEYKY